MSVPMKKNEPEVEEELTTADLAQGKRPMSEDRPRPVLAGSSSQGMQQNAQTPSTDVRNTSDATPLFPNNELEDLRNRWSSVQTAFVDEPRSAVEQADGLVATAMKRSLCRGTFQTRAAMGSR